MKSVLASSVLGVALALTGTASAHDGFSISVGIVRGDYFHDHVLGCGCRVRCNVYDGDHHYRHRHGRDGGYSDDRHYRGGYNGDRYYGDRYNRNRYDYDDRYRDDRGSRRNYWHDHYVGRGGFVRCHVKGGVHYFRRY